MITNIILGISVILSIMSFQNQELFRKLAFDPFTTIRNKEYYRIISHAFIHGDWMHLFVNMFVLYQFGGVVESLFEYDFGAKGSIYFLTLYVGGIVAASLPALKKHADNPYYNAVGASGAVAAVLFSFILMRPTAMLGLFLIIPIPAVILGVLYLWYEKKMSNANDRIAHDAHYWGAIFGIVATLAFRPQYGIEFATQIIAGIQGLLM